MIVILLHGLTLFSQSNVTVTVGQLRQVRIMEMHYRECQEYLSVSDSLNNEYQNKILLLENKVDTMQENRNSFEVLLNLQKNKCDTEKGVLQKEITKQKRHKWFAIGGSVGIIVLLVLL